jgi:hypothetical protein
MSNVVVVSTYRRPFSAKLCLEALARCQRWSEDWVAWGSAWADKIVIGISAGRNADPDVEKQAVKVVERNPDIPFEIVKETCDSHPNNVSKWLLDYGFKGDSVEAVLYVEDDAILATDAFHLCEWTKQFSQDNRDRNVIGCCCYHETIPAHYAAEGRSPDDRLIRIGNGLNTCGGTMFLRAPYFKILAPNWNCKQVEPKGFDYSAHYLMYLNNLFMMWPDLSRSFNIGFERGALSYPIWLKYFGQSIWTTTRQSARSWKEFKFDGSQPKIFKEPWMEKELGNI